MPRPEGSRFSPDDVQHRQTGGKMIRRSNWWSGTTDDVFMKPARNIGVNENNVVLPAPAIAVLAAAGVANLTLTAQRDCLIRDLVLDASEALADLVQGRSLGVTGITVAGENCFGGVGQAPISMFYATAFNRPEFDMPVKGGTAVIVGLVNNSVLLGYDVYAAARID